MGSQLHQTARWFAIGIRNNRIIQWNRTEDRPWTKGPECHGDKTFDCFFQPLSNCTISADSDVLDSKDFENKTLLPDWHREIVKRSPIDPRAYPWHWVAQVLGYVFRLNEWAMSEVINYATEAKIPQSLLRPGGFDIAVHIRHGDKYEEMTLIHDDEYIRTVKMVKRMLNRNVSVFLLTDDTNSVRSFEGVSGIQLYYLHYPYREYNRYETLRDFGAKAAMYALADVWIAAHANWQIGTWMSGIDRMILELKAVSFGLASKPMLELERSCVSATHCHALHYDFDYCLFNWFQDESSKKRKF
jgi:hypothetical protein